MPSGGWRLVRATSHFASGASSTPGRHLHQRPGARAGKLGFVPRRLLATTRAAVLAVAVISIIPWLRRRARSTPAPSVTTGVEPAAESVAPGVDPAAGPSRPPARDIGDVMAGAAAAFTVLGAILYGYSYGTAGTMLSMWDLTPDEVGLSFASLVIPAATVALAVTLAAAVITLPTALLVRRFVRAPSPQRFEALASLSTLTILLCTTALVIVVLTRTEGFMLGVLSVVGLVVFAQMLVMERAFARIVDHRPLRTQLATAGIGVVVGASVLAYVVGVGATGSVVNGREYIPSVLGVELPTPRALRVYVEPSENRDVPTYLRHGACVTLFGTAGGVHVVLSPELSTVWRLSSEDVVLSSQCRRDTYQDVLSKRRRADRALDELARATKELQTLLKAERIQNIDPAALRAALEDYGSTDIGSLYERVATAVEPADPDLAAALRRVAAAERASAEAAKTFSDALPQSRRYAAAVPAAGWPLHLVAVTRRRALSRWWSRAGPRRSRTRAPNAAESHGAGPPGERPCRARRPSRCVLHATHTSRMARSRNSSGYDLGLTMRSIHSLGMEPPWNRGGSSRHVRRGPARALRAATLRRP